MSRDLIVDNAKGMLIVLVITGHLIEGLMKNSEHFRTLFSVIYLFHMPMFVFIVGMFSKGTWNARDIRGLFSRLVIPFVIFQVLYVGVTSYIAGYWTTPLLSPYWILWFLVSVTSWKLLLPIVLRLGGGAAILLLAAIAIGAGHVDFIGRTLSVSRTLMFFPAFVVGHLYGRTLISWAQHNQLLARVIFLILVNVTGATFYFGNPAHEPLFGHVPYSAIPKHLFDPGLERGLILFAGLVAAVAGFALVPKSNSFLTYLGQRTLTIFIAHGFLMLLAWHLFAKLNFHPSLLVVPLIVAGSVAIAAVLALADGPLNRLFDYFSGKLIAMLSVHFKRSA